MPIRRNLARWDRAVRILLGMALLAYGLAGAPGEIKTLSAFVFAWLPLLTGLAGWSPLYEILGIRTRRP